MNLSLQGQLMYNKEGKKTQQGRDNLFNKLYWENWTIASKTGQLQVTESNQTTLLHYKRNP